VGACFPSLFIHTKENIKFEIIDLLFSLTTSELWEIRYSGFLALKYIFAKEEKFESKFLISSYLPSLINGIQDQQDDVRDVAAKVFYSFLLSLTSLSGHYFYFKTWL